MKSPARSLSSSSWLGSLLAAGALASSLTAACGSGGTGGTGGSGGGSAAMCTKASGDQDLLGDCPPGADTAPGEALFAERCLGCHSMGVPACSDPPGAESICLYEDTDYTDPMIRTRDADEMMERLTACAGNDELGMPRAPLNDAITADEIEDIRVYLACGM